MSVGILQESSSVGGHDMNHEEIKRRLEGCEKVLVGLGEEWKLVRGQYDGRREQVCRA